MNSFNLDKKKKYLGVFVKINLDSCLLHASVSFFKEFAHGLVEISKLSLQ